MNGIQVSHHFSSRMSENSTVKLTTTRAATARFGAYSAAVLHQLPFPLKLPHCHCVLVRLHCRSMSEHLSVRLHHSLCTGYEPNRVPIEEVVDFTGEDSDDDRSHENQDAHAIALTLPHQLQPQQVMQGSLLHAGGNSILIHHTQYWKRSEHPSVSDKLLIENEPTGSGRDVKHCSIKWDSSQLQLNNVWKHLSNNWVALLNMRTLRRTWR